MNEKIIQEIKEKSELIGKVEISEEIITDMPLADFYEAEGKLYYFKEENVFYKEQKDGWLRYRPQNESKIEEGVSPEDILNLVHRVNDYVNLKFEELSKRLELMETKQEEFFKEIKDYVNFKLNVPPSMEGKKEGTEVKNDFIRKDI